MSRARASKCCCLPEELLEQFTTFMSDALLKLIHDFVWRHRAIEKPLGGAFARPPVDYGVK